MERLVEIAFHEPALGPIHGRSADPDAARDRLIRRAGIGRQQDLRPFQLAHRMLAAAQHRPQLTAFVLAEIDQVSYVHRRSEEHTSELQSLMRISYAVFCLKKQKKRTNKDNQDPPILRQ